MHTLIDFKGFAEASINLVHPLTVLIGPNGSGKTNLIEAVELLSFIASGQPLHNITDVGRGGALEIRGGLQSCARRNATQFTLGFRGNVAFTPTLQKECHYELTIRTMPTPEILAECLRVNNRLWFDAAYQSNTGMLEVWYDDFAQEATKPSVSVPASSSVLARYATIATNNKQLQDCARLAELIHHHLRRAYVFDPSPRLMRGYDRIGNNVLHRDGANLSSVLYDLSTTDDGQLAFERITDRIRQLPEEPFAEIGFETTRLKDVIFGFRAEPEGPLLDARLLSDGTLRTLAVLTALETCEPESRIVIEEFDNGVHPTRLAMLSEALIETATRRRLNVLVTTHNPATLDALPPTQLDGVLVCHWKKAEGVAAVIPLLELPRADEMLERGRLGDLVTRRIVEAYLAPESDAERNAQVENWLKSLP
jgi:predicted ATPase